MAPDYFIQFKTGDVAGIHPGYRGVAVKLIGRKWVHCVLTSVNRNFKMRRHTWELLTKHPVKDEKSQL